MGKSNRWIAKILEYDLEIKPTKLVKGKGLAKLLTESNYKSLGIHVVFNNSILNESQYGEKDLQLYERFMSSTWYKYIVYFLQTLQCPPDMDKLQVRYFKLKVVKYCIMDQSLFWKDPKGILLNYVEEDEAQTIMTKMHKGACGGHHY
jgi:hypothetical protein